jgi:ribosomal protein S18 acetylase RimI-like enzyme
MGRETQTAQQIEAVRDAQPHESRSLQATLGAAFLDDPVFGWLVGGSRRQPRLERYFALQLAHALADGCVWTADGLAGAALCMPPDRWRLPPRSLIAHGGRYAGVFRGRLPRAVGLLAAIERRHLREPHYYFSYIGVAPEAQGMGLGSRLMGPALDRCDEERLPAYLEASSERNAALYERLGFRCIEVLRFAGSPPLRLMVRPPQPRPAAA